MVMIVLVWVIAIANSFIAAFKKAYVVKCERKVFHMKSKVKL